LRSPLRAPKQLPEARRAIRDAIRKIRRTGSIVGGGFDNARMREWRMRNVSWSVDSSKDHQIREGSIIGLAILSIGIAVGGIIVWKSTKDADRSRRVVSSEAHALALGWTRQHDLSIEYRVLALSFNPSVSEDRVFGPPVITEIRGKAKFLYSRPDPTLRLPLGYVFDVTSSPRT